MHTAYLLIGGNLGNRQQNLQEAQQFINQQAGYIIATSSIYETAAWGFEEQPSFLNQVIVINTSLQPNQLMKTLLTIEKEMGRERNVKFGPRIIDIDILLIDELVIHNNLLSVPHPALPNRRFALVPLNEVAASIIHPVEKKSIAQLLEDCPDELYVQKFTTTV
jgi:2-amino-4-hydroxy-6-hydroxymethyldihydropteridine diphosphokinase